MTAPAPARTLGACAVCGRSVELGPNGRVNAHGDRKERRWLTAEERWRGVSPDVWRGRCPGTHQKPIETTEV